MEDKEDEDKNEEWQRDDDLITSYCHICNEHYNLPPYMDECPDCGNHF